MSLFLIRKECWILTDKHKHSVLKCIDLHTQVYVFLPDHSWIWELLNKSATLKHKLKQFCVVSVFTVTHCMQARKWEMIPTYQDQMGSNGMLCNAYLWLVLRLPTMTGEREKREETLDNEQPEIHEEPATDQIQMRRRRKTIALIFLPGE